MARMTRMAWVWLGTATLVIGCAGRMIGGGHDGGSDGSIGPSDAGVDAALDAGTDAGSLPDAGPPDSGPPPCGCAPFPAACAAPVANVPAFTPDADAMLGQLFDVIACADTTLQIAMYEAEWPCLGNALQTALDRDPDLTIQVVTDDDRCAVGSCIFDALPSARVTVVRDTPRTSYMHHKFVVADGARAWIGSANFSERSFCVDHNNSIVVDQTEIVDAYEALFTQLFSLSFGPVTRDPIAAAPYTLYVSPESPTTMPADWQNDIIAALDAAGAGARIDVMMNAWTVVEFATAIVGAHDRGATVRALVSNVYADDAPAQALLAAGIEVRRGNIHDKLVVIDDVVFTGSANWSENARTNNESVLRMDDAAVAAAYRAEMDAVFPSARTVDPVP